MNKYSCGLGIAGLALFASVGFAQYTMELTGVGDGAVADGVYVSPYQGNIWTGAYTSGNPVPTSSPSYSGYVICNDFSDESYLDAPWNATETNAGALTGSELFNPTNTGLTAQQVQENYDAVAWLANELLMPANLTNSTNQTDISFAIWDIMDGQTTNPDGGALTQIANAFAAVQGGYVGTNVTVFTPSPTVKAGGNPSQEFLVVTTPEVSTPVLLAVDLLGFIGLVGFLRKRALRNT